jgi:hypothetical protein
MVRDIRTSPRGLLAPLKQSELASLRDFADGKLLALPVDHHARLFDLELIAMIEGRLCVTELGRERLISDR